jgi:hypothetical protein
MIVKWFSINFVIVMEKTSSQKSICRDRKFKVANLHKCHFPVETFLGILYVLRVHGATTSTRP